MDASRQSIVFRMTSSIYVAVHAKTPPSDNDWRAYVDDMERYVARIRGVLVYSYGVGPNATQRRYVAEMWKRTAAVPPIAVVGPKEHLSPLARAMLTALTWFMMQPLKAFPVDDIQGVLEHYLKVPNGEQHEVLTTLNELAASMGLAPITS